MGRPFSTIMADGLKQVTGIMRDAAALASSSNQVKVRGDKMIKLITSLEGTDVEKLTTKEKVKVENLKMELRTKLTTLKEDVAHANSSLPSIQDINALFKTD